MTALFTIDCHACGAKNTIDTETMRRVGRPERHQPWCMSRDSTPTAQIACNCRDYTLMYDPEDAA